MTNSNPNTVREGIRTARRYSYLVARGLGDIASVRKGRVGTRIGRRAIGRATGLLLRKLFN